ncbi:YgaP family membrane protein [Legionella sp. CNM-4043-24]
METVPVQYLLMFIFLWFTVFVGLNLFQSGFTGFCPLELILKKFIK